MSDTPTVPEWAREAAKQIVPDCMSRTCFITTAPSAASRGAVSGV